MKNATATLTAPISIETSVAYWSMYPAFITSRKYIGGSRHFRLQFRNCSSRCLFTVPPDQFQIQHDKRVQNRNQSKRDERGDGHGADLGIAQRFPKRTTVCCQWEQRDHSG